MTDLSREIEIEPLSEQEWRRIDRRVFERLDQEPLTDATPVLAEGSRRVPWRAAFGLAAVGAAAAAFVLLLQRGDSPGSAPLQTSRIVTNDASSHVEFGGAALDVAPRSVLVVSGSDESGVLVVLESGSVRCAVAPREGRSPFAVQSGDVRVEVVGTIFTVTRDGDETQVEVAEGTVRVLRAGEAALVHAGERWPASPLASAGDVAESDDEIVIGEDETEAITRKRPRSRSVEPRAAAGEPRAPKEEPRPPSAEERYNEAQRLEASNPAAAIALYREVARAGGKWGANALYAQALLELERGNTGEARRLLKRYVNRYPKGANIRDAKDLLEGLRD
jgi:hypothetical protein